MKHVTGLVLLAFLLGIAGLPALVAGEEPLVFGMSTALTGPAGELGRNMRSGVMAAFEETNRAGGIGGRRLELQVLDDGYEPARTAPNMRQLIETSSVLGIVGNVGTPTAVAAVPIARETRTPFFGAFTGAGLLRRTPPERYVINYRASYAEETSAMVDALIEHGGLSPREIAFFTQRDSYGDAGFVGGVVALERHGLKRAQGITHGRYERNTVNVEGALAEILLAQPMPRAVIMVGAYAPCARFIQLAREARLEARFLNVSFVGADPLKAALGEQGDGVIITQVVPHFEADLPVVQSYRAALASLDEKPTPTFGSLEGYIAARILIEALSRPGVTLTRDGVVEALEALGSFELGLGAPLRLAPDEHQASHRVWPTVIERGRFVPFSWNQLGSR